MENNTEELKEQLASHLSILDLTEAQEEEIASELEENIYSEVSIAILDCLTGEEKEELIDILESEDNDSVLRYLSSKIKGLDALVKKVTQETIEEFDALRANP